MKPVRPDRILRPYWEALPQETRDGIEAAVPPGHFIYILAGHKAKPGTATVSLRREPNTVVVENRGQNLAGLCRYVLSYVAIDVPEPVLRVTVDGEGYIRDMEDVA